jgi:hypothetical protein
LPDNKKITEIKWLAVYDLSRQNTFGDVYIPEEFEPPTAQKISRLMGRSHDVDSENIEIIDSKTIKISQFIYNGKGKGENFLYSCLVCGLIKTDSFVETTASSVYRQSDNQSIPLLHPKVHCYHHNSLQCEPLLTQFS